MKNLLLAMAAPKMIIKLFAIIAVAFSLFIYAVPAFAAAPASKSKPCPSPDTVGCCPESNDLQNNCIIRDLNIIVNFLSAGVGLAVVGTIIVGGIQYSMADKPEGIQKAKTRIINGVIAMATFMLTFAFLQWLIPGGIFK